VDGRYPHWVTPYSGERYSIIYYRTCGETDPMGPAILPSPPRVAGSERLAEAGIETGTGTGMEVGTGTRAGMEVGMETGTGTGTEEGEGAGTEATSVEGRNAGIRADAMADAGADVAVGSNKRPRATDEPTDSCIR
jgi:hypothetical protein